MNRISITTTEQLRAWLSTHGYFEESYCLLATPAPNAASTSNLPNTVVFELAEQTNGAWKAGDVRVLQVFRCTAADVRDWTPGSDLDPYLDAGVEVFDVENWLGIDLDRHGRLVCGHLTIEQLPDRTILIEPSPDPNSVCVQVPAVAVPSPRDWIKWFAEAGEDVGWRVYGGEELQADQMRADTYSGSLQRRRAMHDTSGGIFTVVQPSRGGGFSAMLTNPFERSQADGDKLWQSGREILLRFSDAKFSTGNCVWTGDNWEKYVRDCREPPMR